MYLLGSCLALNISYSGCCLWSLSPTCINDGCYCDHTCHTLGDCCSDIADIGCHSVLSSSPTPSNTLGKSISESDAIHKNKKAN